MSEANVTYSHKKESLSFTLKIRTRHRCKIENPTMHFDPLISTQAIHFHGHALSKT